MPRTKLIARLSPKTTASAMVTSRIALLRNTSPSTLVIATSISDDILTVEGLEALLCAPSAEFITYIPSEVTTVNPSQRTRGHKYALSAKPINLPVSSQLWSCTNLLSTQPVLAAEHGGSGSPSPEGPPPRDSHGSRTQVLSPGYVASA